MTIRCSKCGTEMRHRAGQSDAAWHCRDCKGVFLEQQALLEAVDARRIDDVRLALQSVDELTQTVLPCPTGDGGKLESFDLGGVEIDRCPDCRGLYFDAGELRAVASGKKPRKRGRDLDGWADAGLDVLGAMFEALIRYGRP